MFLRTALCGAVVAAALSASGAMAQDNYKIRLVAGSPGYDHIQPFMAELKGIWDKYGLNVDFMGGNYQRSNQMMSIGDFDAGYNQIASAIRYNSAGIANVIVAPRRRIARVIVAAPNVNSWEDLKGKRFGIVTKFDVQYLTLTEHILPRFGLSDEGRAACSRSRAGSRVGAVDRRCRCGVSRSSPMAQTRYQGRQAAAGSQGHDRQVQDQFRHAAQRAGAHEEIHLRASGARQADRLGAPRRHPPDADGQGGRTRSHQALQPEYGREADRKTPTIIAGGAIMSRRRRGSRPLSVG